MIEGFFSKITKQMLGGESVWKVRKNSKIESADTLMKSTKNLPVAGTWQQKA